MRNRVFLPASLIHLAWRYVLKRGWQSALMVLGVALGVAVMVSIDLANASATRAFELSSEAVTGKATHQILPSGNGLDERIYLQLRSSGIDYPAAPVISAYVSSPRLGNQPLQLLGVDLFADAAFRDYFESQVSSQTDISIELLTEPGMVILSADEAERHQLRPGENLQLEYNGRVVTAVFLGTIQPGDALTRRGLQGILLADIATVQELTGRLGLLDRIDLILPADSSAAASRIENLLPDGAALVEVEARQGSLAEMTKAFQLNLTALSLLALVVGLFLIYNTMTFSVVQRRPLFGTLRSLGVSRREVFFLVAAEAFFVGLFGSAAGVLIGILLGQNTVSLVTQTVNDLYFTTTIREIGLPASSLIKGFLLGLAATVATALPPAIEASAVEPRAALLRSGLETKTRAAVGLATILGVVFIGLGLITFRIPGGELLYGFGGTLLVLTGLAMLAAIGMLALMKAAAPLSARLFGIIGRMAPRNLINALSRTSVAVAALMVAVAVTIGVSLMINSFRYTVGIWLEQTLQGDVYISAPSFAANQSLVEIDADVYPQVAAWPGIQRVDLLRSTTVNTEFGEVHLSASRNPEIGFERIFKEIEIPRGSVYAEMQRGGVLLTEPLANRLGLKAGDRFRIDTPAGWREFPIIGIYYDYSSSQGLVLMALSLYRELWDDQAITAMALRLPPDADPDRLAEDLSAGIRTEQKLTIRPNLALRRDVMEVFDRTFAITGALRILATIVAFIGVLSTLLLLQLEKQREIGILKALGLSGGELWRLVMLETSLMGLAAGILAAPTGFILALILIRVINLRSFGWTLQLSAKPSAFLFSILIALTAALLAGILPAWRLSRMSAADAIRFE